MSVYFDPKREGWRFDFQFRGARYQSPRPWATKREAEEAEAAQRRAVKREAAGVDGEPAAIVAPSFTAWAGHYFAYCTRQAAEGHLDHPEIIRGNLNVILQFWGAAPSDPALHVKGAPYHDCRLSDPIADPAWLGKFDAWIDRRGVANGTRRHYLNTIQRLYWLAVAGPAEYRALAPSITSNPYAGRSKPAIRKRTATITPDQLLAWLGAASYHIRLTMAIAALAPKLRVANILGLEWARHVDLEASTITVYEHKTDSNGAPLTTPIGSALRAILLDARRRAPHASHVIVYRGAPIRTCDEGVKGAALEAGIPYGRALAHGATFHTIRHSMATLLARMGVAEATRTAAMGWRDPGTASWYTHLDIDDQRAPLEGLGERLGLVDTVTAGRARAARTKRNPRRGLLTGSRLHIVGAA